MLSYRNNWYLKHEKVTYNSRDKKEIHHARRNQSIIGKIRRGVREGDFQVLIE